MNQQTPTASQFRVPKKLKMAVSAAVVVATLVAAAMSYREGNPALAAGFACYGVGMAYDSPDKGRTALPLLIVKIAITAAGIALMVWGMRQRD